MTGSRRGTRAARPSLEDVYARLLERRGPAGWWPAESAFEVCVGAILVQNTAWANAARALDSLRKAGRLSYDALAPLSADAIAPLIRSAGCHNVKARRLVAFLAFLGDNYGGRVENMRAEPVAVVRRKLLAVPGVGRETADCIVLYAAGLPLFVLDAYTRRIFSRLGLVSGDETYEDLQAMFMAALPVETALFNDYHAQIVDLGKDVCRPRPRCASCPLDPVCLKVGVLSS